MIRCRLETGRSHPRSLLIHSEIVIVPSSEIKLPLSSNINHKPERSRVKIQIQSQSRGASKRKSLIQGIRAINISVYVPLNPSHVVISIDPDPGYPVTLTLVPCLGSPISHPSSWTKSVHKRQINDTRLKWYFMGQHHFTTLPAFLCSCKTWNVWLIRIHDLR